ncbi:sensor histidine kinase [Natronorubrum texcoconense]|uniref:histidine kinase n=1 Tax=Natronorubrum texcoconense TaxID=1095776 RepID=A0A1G9BVG3_9EURY|nr:HAMP domain-containing sensor histidine kinase [Natronorubrum texcoconense]SDK42955.1 Signal transduction histidine kinase [Natronorubrum texcoconense]
MSDGAAVRRPTDATVPWLVGGLGALSFAFFFGWSLWFASELDPTAIALGFVTVAVPALGLVWGGYRLERSTIGVDRHRRIAQWCFGCGVGFLAVNALIMIFFPWHTTSGNISWAQFSLNVGAVAGLTVGYVEARAIQREVEATAATVRAERLAEEREVLTYLNDLLRHEVLNSAQIINGHASLLLEDADDRSRTHLETIDRKSDALTDVIDDVRAMLNASRESDATERVDLGDLLDAEVTALDDRIDELEIDADVPDAVFVSGNEGLRWVFANVLENAVEHNDSEHPRIAVTVETQAETVTVRIADNGPGISAETRETLFDRKSRNHGLGLYLVYILVHRYGGSVELTETGPQGSVFSITLARADATDDDGEPTRDPKTDTAHGTETTGSAESEPISRTGSQSDDGDAGLP